MKHRGPQRDMKPIPGFNGYCATDDGSIVSTRSGTARAIRARVHKGYLVVTVRGIGARERHPVHRMVLAAYAGAPPFDGAVCRHLNGCAQDNRPSNLAWGTCRDNYADAVQHGTKGHGMRAPRRKLTEEQVVQIRARSAAGESSAALAREYKIHATYVPMIVRRDYWPHA